MSQDDPNETTPEPQTEPAQPLAESMASVRDTRQLKRAVFLVVVLALVVLALTGRYYVRRAGGEPQITAPYKCYSCGHITSVKAAPGTPIDVCPNCHKATLRPAYKCSKCGTLEVLNEDRGLEPPTKCPKCGTEIRHGE